MIAQESQVPGSALTRPSSMSRHKNRHAPQQGRETRNPGTASLEAVGNSVADGVWFHESDGCEEGNPLPNLTLQPLPKRPAKARQPPVARRYDWPESPGSSSAILLIDHKWV